MAHCRDCDVLSDDRVCFICGQEMRGTRVWQPSIGSYRVNVLIPADEPSFP